MDRLHRREEIPLCEIPTHVLQNAYNEATERIRDKELEVHELQVAQFKMYEELVARREGADAPMDEVAG